MDKNINNIKDYLDQLVWEYGQACQRPRGDLYFIASGKQCRQGKPVSEAAVQAIREKKRKESLLGKKSDRSTDPSIGGKIGGVWGDEQKDGNIGWLKKKPTNSLFDNPSPGQRDKINKRLVDFLRDKEYDPERRKFVPKKKSPGASDEPKKPSLKDLYWDPVNNEFVLRKPNKAFDKGRESESERDSQWKKERDLKKLLEGRNRSGWNPRATRNDGLIGLTSNPTSVQGNENRAVIQKLKDVVVSGRGSLSKSEEESLRKIIVSGWGTNYQRALIEKYITGGTTMVPPELERDYFSRGDNGSSSIDDPFFVPTISPSTLLKKWGNEK